MDKIIVITGATATGKTEISIELAKTLNGEIISADSMMVYKYMDIGTAKPTVEERQGIPHYLIDIKYPNEKFDAKEFVEQAKRKITDIQKKGKVPIIVGGTWLYIQSLLYGLSDAPEGNWEIREKLYKKSNQQLFEQLEKIDPEYAKKIHLNDKKRIVRALEVFYTTGKPFSTFHKKEKKPVLNFKGFVFERPRDEIMHRIEKRVNSMIEKGLIEEVEFLVEKGYSDSIVSMQAIGYKELLPYLEGKIDFEEAKNNIIKNTKSFAKRQIRTFRSKFKDDNDRWNFLNVSQKNNLINYILNKL